MAEDSQNKSATSGISKIPPYPIPIEISHIEEKPPLKGNIVKMTEIGFLMKVETIHFYKVGEILKIQFKLPVVNTVVRCEGKVVKTYDAIDSIVDNVVSRTVEKLYTVEIHFRNIMEKEKASIISYLFKSGQKKF